MNQRIQNAIAKEVTEDLLGHHTMHAHCASRSGASLSVVAPSRVPVRLDVQREVYPPLHSRALSKFSSLDSGDFCRPVVFDPARILCVAGYFCCIGNSVSMPIFLPVVRFPVLPALLLRGAFATRLLLQFSS